MKKINTISLLSILLLFASCGNNVCEETIEKLALTENGFCGISLGDQVSDVAYKIGDVDPAAYLGYWVNEITENRVFNGVQVVIMATFPRLWLTSEHNGIVMWQDYGDGRYGASKLTLAIPCHKEYNDNMDGKRVELYETICNYYREQCHAVLKETNESTSLFQIGFSDISTSETHTYQILFGQDIEYDCVTVEISKE